MICKHYIVKSSAIRSIAWIANSAFVEFADRDVYLIRGIEHALVQDWVRAESKGAFYTSYIKGHFPCELVQEFRKEIVWNKDAEFDPINLEDIDCHF